MQRVEEIICKHLRCGQTLAIRSHGFVVTQVPKCEGPGAPGFLGTQDASGSMTACHRYGSFGSRLSSGTGTIAM